MSTKPIRIEMPLGLMFQTVNCYLVPGEQLTLIDCGWPTKENWELLQDKIKASGYQLSDIEQVIITHEHLDHIGLLPEIMANCDATIRMPRAIEDWFKEPEETKRNHERFTHQLFSQLGFPDEAFKQLLSYFDKIEATEKINDLGRVRFFEEGDYLQIGNRAWEALNTPGHCPTQFVFWQKEENSLLSSDMLLPITTMPIIVEDPKQAGKPTRSLPDLLNSFERLRGLDIQTVYPGHGEVFSNANAMMKKQLERLQMRKEECYQAVISGLKTPYEINRKMYPYQQMPPDFSGMYMILGYLSLLEMEGRVLKIEKDNEMPFYIKH